jgi:hypothetical protein
MRIDQLYQFLVPLMFLAIWALTSLLNRDAQPLPPRTGPGGRSPNPYGPRSGSEPMTANDLRPDPFRPEGRPSPAQGAPGRPAAPRPRPLRSHDEGIVILEQDSGSTKPTRLASSTPRRAGRGRSTSPTQPKKKESTPRQTFGTPLSSSPLTGSTVTHTESLAPLSLVATATIAETTSIQTSRIESPRTRPVERKAVSIEEIHELLRSPARVGEAFILSELLSAPVSMRGRRNRR